MQRIFSKTQGIWTLSWGLSIILLAIGVIIGLDVVNFTQTVTGISYIDILYVSGLLFTIGIGFGLSAAKSTERQYLHRISIIWILMILLGIVFYLLSATMVFTQKNLAIGNITLDYTTWQPWFYISVALGLYGLILFFGSMEDPSRETFWKIWPIYLLLILIGFVCSIFSIIAMYSFTGYHSFLSITSDNWIIYGSLPMMLGLIPFAYNISSKESFKEKLDKLWLVWLVIALIGVIVYIIAASDILFNLASNLKLSSIFTDYSTILDINGLGKEPELLVGLPFALIGFTFLLTSLGRSGTNHLRTLLPVWILITIIGIIILPLNSLVPDTFKNSTLALGLSIAVFGAAMTYKVFSVDYIPELGRRPLTQTTVRTGEFEKALGITDQESVPEHATPEEKTLFLTIRKKSIENSQVQFSTAFKLGRCSEAFYLAITDKYRSEIEKIDDQIANVRDTAKRSTRKSIFEEEIRRTEPIPATSRGVMTKGESTNVNVSSTAKATTSMPSPPGPPGVPPAPPTIKSSSNSSAPPKPPSGGSPPPPPGMTAPRPATTGPPNPPPLPTATGGPPPPPGFSSPRPSGSPPPPPLPTGGIPPPPGIGSAPRPSGSVTPTGPPPPPTGGMPLGTGSSMAPGTDVVGTARSTSIAELRGEMLKELRRLRDIFKEEGGPKP